MKMKIGTVPYIIGDHNVQNKNHSSGKENKNVKSTHLKT